MSDDFTLHSVIRCVLRDNDTADPHELVQLVMDQIPADQIREALRQSLRQSVRTYAATNRVKPGRFAPTYSLPDHGSVVAHARSGGQGPTLPTGQVPRVSQDKHAGRAHSPKLAAVRSWWTAKLADRTCVNGEWKMFADCTPADLLFLVQDRQARAASMANLSAWYQSVHDHMVTHNAKTVADLPVGVGVELGRAA